MRSEKQRTAITSEDKILPSDFQEFRGFLEKKAGIVLGDNKAYLVASRLNHLMREYEIDSFSDLIKRIKLDESLGRLATDAMTTNETSWFRDSFPYEILQYEILPTLVSANKARIRIWSAACSTGQEPYSIAMVVAEYLQKNRAGISQDGIEIIGTDLSTTALNMARQGVYDNTMAGRGLLAEQKQRYFVQQNKSWHLSEDIKKRVSFRELNLKGSYSTLGKFDVIYCRNVMIYFSTELKTEVLQKMATALNPGGFLIVGGSESVTNNSDQFELYSWRDGVVYRLT